MIIKCPNCGKEISDKASKCVYCGTVFNEQKETEKEMLCQECGKTVYESDKLCPYCGCPTSKSREIKDKFKKKIIALIAIPIAVVLIAGIAVFNSASVKKYMTEREKNNASLKASTEAFKIAKEAEKDNDIELALKRYNAVISTDKHYKKAQERIASIRDKYKNEKLTEANNYIQNKQYNEAIQTITDAMTILGESDELVGVKNEYAELKGSRYVKVVCTDKSVTPADYDKWIFNSYIDLSFEVTNNCDKDIKGVEGRLTTSDLFGNEIEKTNCNFIGETIEAGKMVFFEYMSLKVPMYPSETDQKLMDTDYSDLKFSYEVSKIVFTDGSTIVPE